MVLLNIPALVVTVLCWLRVGLNKTMAIVAVAANTMAMVAVTIREGATQIGGKASILFRIFQASPASIQCATQKVCITFLRGFN